MAKEQEKKGTEETSREQEKHEVFGQAVREAVRSACCQNGGLMMHLRWRGSRQVNETVTFGHQTEVEVSVNPRNYDVTLVLDGGRYLTAAQADNSKLIRDALSGRVNFEENFFFRGPWEEERATRS